MNGYDDELAVTRAQRSRIEPECGELLGPDATDQDVGLFDESQQRVARCFLLEIQNDAPLTPIGAYKGRAHAGLDGGARDARAVATGRLDLDHVGAVITQHLRGVRAKQHARKIKDADAGQWGRQRCGHWVQLKNATDCAEV